MASPKVYNKTVNCVMNWAKSELEHVGRIIALEDPDLQYSYAMSTVNGMAHLKDALYELLHNPDYVHHHPDLRKTHDSVIRTMKHLIKDFDVDLGTIEQFNTRHVLSNLSYLKNSKTRKTKRSRK
jgi:hypothetical protein